MLQPTVCMKPPLSVDAFNNATGCADPTMVSHRDVFLLSAYSSPHSTIDNC